MVNKLEYETVALVLSSWEGLRRVKNYEEVIGVKLFQNFFYDCPEAKELFGFARHIDVFSNELLQSKRFKIHAIHFIKMLDESLYMLGPDIELLTEILYDLGEKHVRYGVTKSYFASMGVALIKTLQEVLGNDNFPINVRRAWCEIYNIFTKDMIEGQASVSI